MKVVAICGSPRKHGNTDSGVFRCLDQETNDEKIDKEDCRYGSRIAWIGRLRW